MIDAFGSDIVDEMRRVANRTGEGWIYYAFTNPMTREDGPKASYVKQFDWDGIPAVIGAGIYQRDLPATCREDQISASPSSRSNPPNWACGNSCAARQWNWSPKDTLP